MKLDQESAEANMLGGRNTDTSVSLFDPNRTAKLEQKNTNVSNQRPILSASAAHSSNSISS